MVQKKYSLMIVKSFSLAAGIFFLYSSAIFLFSIGFSTHLYFPSFVSFFIASIAVLLSMVLISEFFSSVHVKFRRPSLKETKNPVYGFVTLFAIGLGTTIGSPLFILIPENVYQYVYVSLISLTIAVGMSFLLAYLYAKMGEYSYEHKIEAFGGPSFIRSAYGRGSVRYFISRFSMWVANTALAAFSVIYFVDFDLTIIPQLLASVGLNGFYVNAIIISIVISMVVWFIINAFFEKRFIRTIGHIQIVFLVIMISIIFVDAVDLGFHGSWNMSGIFQFHGSVLSDTVMNTGYLFILFFGYQEIQIMERDSKEKSTIPFLSLIVHHSFPKRHYIPYSMYSVIAAAGIFQILYAIAVFSLHASQPAIEGAVIPAIYIASVFQ
ncbi:MAG: APC family permease, partial [Thermoplasmata archaeon]